MNLLKPLKYNLSRYTLEVLFKSLFGLVGGGSCSEFSVGVCCPVPQIPTQFQTKTCHFPHSFSYHHEYWLSNKPLSAVDHHKHLGVWLESSLSWDYHINYFCGKGNKVLGLIWRTFGPNNSEGVDLTAYKTLVRPILEYGCQVWNPYLVKHVNNIESIQRRATRVICGSGKEYQERLGVLKWP